MALPRFAPTTYAVPTTLSAWLQGDLGAQVQRIFADHLDGATLSRLPRALAVQGLDEGDLSTVFRALNKTETEVARRYPVFHHEMGPVFTGTVQAIPATLEA